MRSLARQITLYVGALLAAPSSDIFFSPVSASFSFDVILEEMRPASTKDLLLNSLLNLFLNLPVIPSGFVFADRVRVSSLLTGRDLLRPRDARIKLSLLTGRDLLRPRDTRTMLQPCGA